MKPSSFVPLAYVTRIDLLDLLFGDPILSNRLHHTYFSRGLSVSLPYDPSVNYKDILEGNLDLYSLASSNMGHSTPKTLQALYFIARNFEKYQGFVKKSTILRSEESKVPRGVLEFYQGLSKNPSKEALDYFMAFDYPQEERLEILLITSRSPQDNFFIEGLRKLHSENFELPTEFVVALFENLISIFADNLQGVRELSKLYPLDPPRCDGLDISYFRSQEAIEAMMVFLRSPTEKLGPLVELYDWDFIPQVPKYDLPLVKFLVEKVKVPIEPLLEWGSATEAIRGEAYEYLLKNVEDQSPSYLRGLIYALIMAEDSDREIEIFLKNFPQALELNRGAFKDDLDMGFHMNNALDLSTPRRAKIFWTLFFPEGIKYPDGVIYMGAVTPRGTILRFPYLIKEVQAQVPEYFAEILEFEDCYEILKEASSWFEDEEFVENHLESFQKNLRESIGLLEDISPAFKRALEALREDSGLKKFLAKKDGS